MGMYLIGVALAVVLGQSAPPGPAWLDKVPPEADAAIYVRGVQETKQELSALVEGLSPLFAEQFNPVLDQGVETFVAQFGEASVGFPWLSIIRVADPDSGANQPYAVLVGSDDYEGVLKSVFKENAGARKSQEGGFESLAGPDGVTWYAAKLPGLVVVGPDKILVAGVLKPSGPTLGQILPESVKKQLFAGDMGLYADVATLSERYAENIQEAREQFMAALDQAGQQAGNQSAMDMAKQMYGGMFDAIKAGDQMAVTLNADEAALDLITTLTVKPDTEMAKALEEARTGDAAELARMPADSAYFVYMNVNPELNARMQAWGMNMMAPSGKRSPAMEAAMELQKQSGRVETAGGVKVTGPQGMRAINAIRVDGPDKYIEGNLALMKAMGTPGKDDPMNFFKEVKVDPETKSYKGYTFRMIEMTFDMEKLKAMQGANPGGAASVEMMFAGGKSVTWIGSNGQQLLTLNAPNWEEATAAIDSYLESKDTIGDVASFQSLRSRLSKQATMMMLISVQGLVEQMATQFAAMSNNPELRVPGDIPKEPALLGASLVSSPRTLQLHICIPSNVGPVVEKGLVPLFQSLQGQVNR